MSRIVPRMWRFPRDKDDYRETYRMYDGRNGRYYYLCDVVIKSGQTIQGVLFSEFFVGAEMQSKQGIPQALYGMEIIKVTVIENRGCSSNAITQALTNPIQIIEFSLTSR